MDYTKFSYSKAQAVQESLSYDVGLRNYFIAVYKQVALALLITGMTAFTVSHLPALQSFLFSMPLYLLIVLAPMGLAIYIGARFMQLSANTVRNYFIAYSVLLGLSLSSLFEVYTGLSISRTFFVSASVFGAMSLYGYKTKTDLSKMGSFLIMGVLGIVIASLVNIFLRSTMVYFIVSVVGVIAFTGLAAYDTQRIKDVYFRVSQLGGETETKIALYGAFTLYLDFINLFLTLLHFMGDRKN